MDPRDKPKYVSSFEEPAKTAYARGVDDGVDWVCYEMLRIFSPGRMLLESAIERAKSQLDEQAASTGRLLKALEAALKR